MVSVKVKFLGMEDEKLDSKVFTVRTGGTLPEAIKAIEEASGFPLSSKLNKDYGMLVNGRSYYLLQKKGFVLSEGDKLVIIPKLGGG